MEKGDRRAGKKVKKERKTKNETVSSLTDLFAIFYEAKVAEGRSPKHLRAVPIQL